MVRLNTSAPASSGFIAPHAEQSIGELRVHHRRAVRAALVTRARPLRVSLMRRLRIRFFVISGCNPRRRRVRVVPRMYAFCDAIARYCSRVIAAPNPGNAGDAGFSSAAGACGVSGLSGFRDASPSPPTPPPPPAASLLAIASPSGDSLPRARASRAHQPSPSTEAPSRPGSRKGRSEDALASVRRSPLRRRRGRERERGGALVSPPVSPPSSRASSPSSPSLPLRAFLASRLSRDRSDPSRLASRRRRRDPPLDESLDDEESSPEESRRRRRRPRLRPSRLSLLDVDADSTPRVGIGSAERVSSDRRRECIRENVARRHLPFLREKGV